MVHEPTAFNSHTRAQSHKSARLERARASGKVAFQLAAIYCLAIPVPLAFRPGVVASRLTAAGLEFTGQRDAAERLLSARRSDLEQPLGLASVGFTSQRSRATSAPKRYQVNVSVYRMLGVPKSAVLMWVGQLRSAGADGVSEKLTPADPDDSGGIRSGPYRRIEVRAIIDLHGHLIVGRYVFRPGDINSLRKFLNKLKREGVPKPDPAAPLWGLTEKQFDRLQEALSKPSQFSLDREPLPKFIERFEESAGVPVSMSEAVKQRAETTRITAETGRIALGTAAAYCFSLVDLAFEPRADAEGNLSLVIMRSSESIRPWPIGLKPESMRNKVAPQLFNFIELQTIDTPLDQIVEAIRKNLDLEVLLDLPAMKAAGIDPAKLRSTAKLPRSTWSSAIRRVLKPLGLVYELRIDEANRPFLWITVSKYHKVLLKSKRRVP